VRRLRREGVGRRWLCVRREWSRQRGTRRTSRRWWKEGTLLTGRVPSAYETRPLLQSTGGETVLCSTSPTLLPVSRWRAASSGQQDVGAGQQGDAVIEGRRRGDGYTKLPLAPLWLSEGVAPWLDGWCSPGSYMHMEPSRDHSDHSDHSAWNARVFGVLCCAVGGMPHCWNGSPAILVIPRAAQQRSRPATTCTTNTLHSKCHRAT
jgi:hypothetical protein